MTFTRSLFLRLLGAIYLIAFVSFWAQMKGLIGSHGILPAEIFMHAAHEQIPGEWWRLPTLAWFEASDTFLNGLCAVGVVGSILLMVGVVPTLVTFLLWLLYLSLVSVGGEFLSFQWDNLLLETGFLAIFLSPLRLWSRPSTDPEPFPVAVWLVRWLLFRLMLESGLVKLLSGDPTWRGLTALTYHYETQPLPTWIGWYVHQLPEWFQRISVGTVFAVELIVPFFVLGPRRLRWIAFWILIPFQILIGLTGNYGFFNLLTIVLCILLLDDQRLGRHPVVESEKPLSVFQQTGRVFAAIVAVAIFAFSGLQLAGMIFGRDELPESLIEVLHAASPFRTINRYGLFAVMTTSRPEILLEGSYDGQTWKAYDFKWKPGALNEHPRFVEPHMPRLDWQMWFAALGSCRRNPWFVSFMRRVLEGEPTVLKLLASNSFSEAPPNYIRASLYDYHFTTWTEKRADGNWWWREPKGLYCPVMVRSKP